MLFKYQYLVSFIRKYRLLSRPGDLLEIGALLGDGTRHLSTFLTGNGPDKTLFVVDPLRADADSTVTVDGRLMSDIYTYFVDASGHGSLEEAFRCNTRGCENVVLLQENSMTVRLPAELCFAFVDGNHAREYVVNDFEKVWAALTPGGAICFDDYGHDLPPVTNAVNACLARHLSEVAALHFEPAYHFVALFKK